MRKNYFFTFSRCVMAVMLLLLAGNSFAQTSYRYLKLTVNSGVSSTYAPNVSELRYVADGVSYPASCNDVSVIVSEGSGCSAFDNNLGTRWGSLNNLPATLIIDFGSGNEISPNAVEITPEWLERALADFEISGSDDNSNWTQLLDVSGLTKDDWTRDVAKSFELNTDEPFDNEAPSVPDNLSVSNIGQTEFSLSWNTSSDNVGVAGYEVFQDGLSIGTTTATSVLVSDLTCNNTYSMRVKAFDAAGNVSSESNALTVSTNECATSYRYIQLKVNAGVSSYEPNVAELRYISGGVSYPASCSEVTIEVSEADGCNAFDNNLGSRWGRLFNLPATLTIDLGEGNEIGPQSVEITPEWTERALAGFEILGSNDNNSWNQLLEVNGLTSSDWTRDVAKSFEIGPGEPDDTEAPTKPSNLNASGLSQTGLTLNWSASSDNIGVSGYEVFQNGSSVGTTSSTSMNITNLTCNTNYTFSVEAYDAAGNRSELSNSTEVATSNCGTNPVTDNSSSPFGMNMDGINPYDNQLVFVNLAHHGLKWSYLGAASCWDRNMDISKIDKQGYLVGGQTGKMAILWAQSIDVAGDYVCTYEGTGTVEMATGTDGNGTDLTVTSSSQGRIEFNLHQLSKLFLILKITENSTNDPIRNIKVFEKRFDGAYQTFYPEFLDDWKNFKVIRYMDWMGTNHSQVKTWDDYPKDNYLIQSRVSFNYMIELANTLNAHAWFCVPLQADDNFVSQMIDKVSTGLNDNLTAYIELSNEVWNGTFSQHKEAAQLARDLGVSNLNRDWEDAPAFYGYRSAQIHNMIDNQWPSTGPDVYRMIAWQQGNTYHIRNFLMPEFQQERNSADVPDGLAIAPYFGHQLGSEENQNIVAGWTVDKLLDQVEFDSHRSEVTGTKLSISDVQGVLQNSISAVNEWNIPELITYEGGQHLSPVRSAANNQAVVDLLIEANRHPRMKDIYIKYHNICKEEGVKLFTVFASCSGFGKFGSWGVKEYGYQTRSEAPKYDGLLTWIGNNTVTWNGKYFTWDDGTKSAKAKTIFEDTSDRSFIVYPNPVKGDAFTVQVPQSGIVTVNDLSGKVVFRETVTTHTLEVPVNNYRSGLYLITIQYDNKIESQKLIVE